MPTSCGATGDLQPQIKDLNDHVVLQAAVKWKDLGVQLLLPQHQGILDIIEKDHSNDNVTCCKCVLKKWLDTTTDATWNQLISALRSPGVQLDYLASQLEQKFPTKTKSKTVAITRSNINSYVAIYVPIAIASRMYKCSYSTHLYSLK